MSRAWVGVLPWTHVRISALLVLISSIALVLTSVVLELFLAHATNQLEQWKEHLKDLRVAQGIHAYLGV